MTFTPLTHDFVEFILGVSLCILHYASTFTFHSLLMIGKLLTEDFTLDRYLLPLNYKFLRYADYVHF